MANYTKATNFYTKDALLTGNPAKIIKGQEIDDEYNSLAIAVNSKADLTSPTFTGIPLAPTASVGTSTTQIATTAFVTAALQLVYQVGAIYSSTLSTNPSVTLGFGTWVAFGEGRVMIGVGGAFTAGATGGSADAIIPSHTHTATVTDPGHNHSSPTGNFALTGGALGPSIAYSNTTPNSSSPTTASNTTGITVANSTTGVSATNANLPPYIVVYMFNRTA